MTQIGIHEIFVSKKYKYWLVLTNIFVLFIVGCQKSVSTQCNLMIEVANKTNQKLSQITQTKQLSNQDLQSWLQAASIFDEAAVELKALKIKDEQLMVYQHELAKLWKIYARTTNDAIDAREKKSLAILTKANKEVKETDEIVQQITTQINSYCGE